MHVEELRVAYGKIVALDGVSLGVGERELVAAVSYTHLTLPTKA
mgnify:CR=1 FL=1